MVAGGRVHAVPASVFFVLFRVEVDGVVRVWREWACRHGFTWLIRVMRLIGGTPVHRIDHVAPIHHDKRSNPPSDPSGQGTRDSRDAEAGSVTPVTSLAP